MHYIPNLLKPYDTCVRKRPKSKLLFTEMKFSDLCHFHFFLYKNAYVILLDFVTENEVFAWGNNAMGQCGQGHTSTPVTKPKKVIGLEGVSIQQITAGTSHSLAWTAVPTDR